MAKSGTSRWADEVDDDPDEIFVSQRELPPVCPRQGARGANVAKTSSVEVSTDGNGAARRSASDDDDDEKEKVKQEPQDDGWETVASKKKTKKQIAVAEPSPKASDSRTGGRSWKVEQVAKPEGNSSSSSRRGNGASPRGEAPSALSPNGRRTGKSPTNMAPTPPTGSASAAGRSGACGRGGKDVGETWSRRGGGRGGSDDGTEWSRGRRSEWNDDSWWEAHPSNEDDRWEESKTAVADGAEASRNGTRGATARTETSSNLEKEEADNGDAHRRVAPPSSGGGRRDSTGGAAARTETSSNLEKEEADNGDAHKRVGTPSGGGGGPNRRGGGGGGGGGVAFKNRRGGARPVRNPDADNDWRRRF